MKCRTHLHSPNRFIYIQKFKLFVVGDVFGNKGSGLCFARRRKVRVIITIAATVPKAMMMIAHAGKADSDSFSCRVCSKTKMSVTLSKCCDRNVFKSGFNSSAIWMTLSQG